MYIKTFEKCCSIFVPYNARVFYTHEEKNDFLIPENFTTLDTRVSLFAEEVLVGLKNFQNVVLKERNKKIETKVSFTNMAEEQLLYEIKLNNSHFSDILNSVQDVLRNSEFAVGMYLFKHNSLCFP